MDRIHRIGQNRKVRAIRFIMKDSIEERFIEVQDAKEALGKGSMERLKKEDRRKATVSFKASLSSTKMSTVLLRCIDLTLVFHISPYALDHCIERSL